MDVGLKQLKVIRRGEDGGWGRVPVSEGHRDKRAFESAFSIFFQFEKQRGAERTRTIFFFIIIYIFVRREGLMQINIGTEGENKRVCLQLEL